MGYSINDLKNAAQTVNERLERRSQERGEALANQWMDRTRQARLVVRRAVARMAVDFCLFQCVSGWAGREIRDSCAAVLAGRGGRLPVRPGLVHIRFTLRHPFWGSVFGYFGTALAVVFMAGKLGISL